MSRKSTTVLWDIFLFVWMYCGCRMDVCTRSVFCYVRYTLLFLSVCSLSSLLHCQSDRSACTLCAYLLLNGNLKKNHAWYQVGNRNIPNWLLVPALQPVVDRVGCAYVWLQIVYGVCDLQDQFLKWRLCCPLQEHLDLYTIDVTRL